jgi:tyrosyl-tRNA synthetase
MGVWYDLLMSSPADPSVKPVEQKRALARAIVSRFHDAASAVAAEAHFDRLFRDHREPEEMGETAIIPFVNDAAVHLPALIAQAFGLSRSDARRMIQQGGVRVGERVLGPEDLDLPAADLEGEVLRAGKRRFTRLV